MSTYTEQAIGTTVVNQHGEEVTRHNDRVFPIYSVNGDRRVGNRPCYATLAESLLANAEGEVHARAIKASPQEKRNMLIQALNVAASAISASDYDDDGTPAFEAQQMVLNLREAIRQMPVER